MIRINLLPVKAQQRLSLLIRQLAVMGAVVLVFLVLCIGWNIKLGVDNGRLTEDVERQEAEIKRLETLIGEVNQFEKERDRLLKQIEVIRDLERGKTGPVKMLDQLASLIPKRVWLSSLSETNMQLTLAGYGVENADISAFMQALEKSPYISAVKLNFTRQWNKFEHPVYEFQLSASLSYKG